MKLKPVLHAALRYTAAVHMPMMAVAGGGLFSFDPRLSNFMGCGVRTLLPMHTTLYFAQTGYETESNLYTILSNYRRFMNTRARVRHTRRSTLQLLAISVFFLFFFETWSTGYRVT